MATEKRLTPAEIEDALAIWAEYQRQHDLSDRIGQAAGIDPSTGRVWFGERAGDIARQQEAEGISTPVFLVRVGSPGYVRKGVMSRVPVVGALPEESVHTSDCRTNSPWTRPQSCRNM